MADESKDIPPSPEEVKEEEQKEDKDNSMETDDIDTSKDESKSETKEEQESGDDAENDEEEEEGELGPGLLERPVVIEDGRKRERKTVERMTFASPEVEEKKFEVEKGKGEMLGDIPYVEFKLSRTKAEDIKPLHRLLFRRVGTIHAVKKNIRKFSGFTFSKDDAEYEKRLQMLKAKSFTISMIKAICEVLDVPRSGSKDEICDRLLEWLMHPENSGKKVPQKRKRKEKKEKGKKEKKTKDKKVKKSKPKAKSKAEAADSDEDEDEHDEDENEDEPEVESDKSDDDKEASDSGDDSDDDFKEPPKKKVKKAATPKVSLKAKKTKTKKEKTPVSKPKKATPKKKATPVKKKEKEVEDDISDISSDSDDEPLKPVSKPKGPPTNDELKDVIKKMLDSANLEEVTMKTVLKDVYDKYPSFDLADRKDFIKNTVKQIIS